MKVRQVKNKRAALSAGLVPIRFDPRGAKQFLVLRVYAYWDFPKGLVERGEEPLVAALRELFEETGISEVRFSWGREFRETAPYSDGKIARYYVCETDSLEVRLSREHHEFRWASRAQADKLLPERVRGILAWADSLSTSRKR